MNAIQKARAWADRARRGSDAVQTPRVFRPPYGGAAYWGQAFKWESVLHQKGWVGIALGASIREVAGSEAPHIGRIITRTLGDNGKLKRKSWQPVRKALGGPKQHEEFEPYPDDHPLVQVFRRPNAHYVAYDLWAYHMLFKGLTGQVYWWVMRNQFGVPVEIWVIPTHWVRMETGHNGEPVSYAVQSPWGQLQHVPYEDVVLFVDHSPLNMYEGAAITQQAAEWIDSYEAQVRARLAMFKNGGAPAFHVLLGESYADPDEAFLARFYAKWMQRFQGEDNWGKPIVTGPDVEVKNVGVAPNDIPFKDGEEMGRDEILAAYGVPKGVLGIEPTADVSSYAPQRQFCRFRINPELKYIGEVVTEKIIRPTPGHEDGTFFFDDHVINDPEQQRADINMRWEKCAISPNQIRVLYGDEPWEFGGDDPVLNGAPIPWGTGKKDQDSQELDDALRGQLGRPEGSKYNLDQLDSGKWTVLDEHGHVVSGPFKTEELAQVGMSKLEGQDAKKEDDKGGDQTQLTYQPEEEGFEPSPIAKDDETDDAAVSKPSLRWHKTPNGDLESRGSRKWRIERVKDRRSGRVSYRLHLDGKLHDDAGALGILKEVAEKVESEEANKKALGEASGAAGGFLVPTEQKTESDDEMKLGANGVVAKTLKRMHDANEHAMEVIKALAARPIENHHTIVNNVEQPEVNPTPVIVRNVVEVEPTPIRVESPTVNIQNNVESPKNIINVPEQKRPKVEVNLPAALPAVKSKKRATKDKNGVWHIEDTE